MFTVTEYAREANLSTARVRALAASGQIPSKKIGNQWVILASPSERNKPRGRLLSQKSFDNLALLLEGIKQPLTPDEKRYTLRRAQKLKEQQIRWAEEHSLRSDETVKSYSVPSHALDKLTQVEGLVLTGTSHENTHVFGDILHAYIPLKKLRKVELIYQLQQAPLYQANVILRAVERSPIITMLKLICDLAYEKEARASTEAQRLLKGLLDGMYL